MIDNDVKFLVRSLASGELTAAAPLLDRLDELDDPRRFDLYQAIGNLIGRAAEANRLAADTHYRRRMSEKELEFRQDEIRYSSWLTFTDGLRDQFWAEFSDESLANILVSIGVLIDVDETNMFTIDPMIENEIMNNGMPSDVHEADDDQAHLQSHIQAARETKQRGAVRDDNEYPSDNENMMPGASPAGRQMKRNGW